LNSALERSWYRRCGWSLLLAPLSLLYGAAIVLRRLAYRRGWLRSEHLPVPVIVVGNITVGGSGKTPLTAMIAARLHARGLKVGIISRGYGGRAPAYPLHVEAGTDPALAGDEPVLLAARDHAVVVVDPQRPRGARLLVQRFAVDIIIADDGLQHYALGRDAEIAVVDGRRGYGNGWLLPAGPLREPRRRARASDLQLVQGPAGDFSLHPDKAQPLQTGTGQARALADFAGQMVHAVAGIAAPQRFFAMLRAHGLELIEHPLADHHAFVAEDIRFADDRPVLMTEKDAVKCRAWADQRHWFVPVSVRLEPASDERLTALLEACVQQAAPTQE